MALIIGKVVCPFIIAIIMKHSLSPAGVYVLSIKCFFLFLFFGGGCLSGFMHFVILSILEDYFQKMMTHLPKLIKVTVKINQVFWY